MTPRTRRLALDLCERLGTGGRVVRPDADGQATEVHPATERAELGRLLLALGVPQGRNHAEADLTLPPWLAAAPRELRLAFGRTDVWNRGSERERESYPVQLYEDRSAPYRQAVRALLNGLVGEPAVRGDSATLQLTKSGAAQLWRPPAL